MHFLHLVIAVTVVWLAVRASSDCAGSVVRVRDAVLSVAEDSSASSALKPGYKLFGAAWCRYTKDQYMALAGTEKFDEGAFKADPNVVDCDGDVSDEAFKTICGITGYPTVLKVDDQGKVVNGKGEPVEDKDLQNHLDTGTPETGVWLGYDKSNTDTFKA